MYSRPCFFEVLVVQCQNSIKYILLRSLSAAMFTQPCKTNFTIVPDPLELQILPEDQTATEILFQSYSATTTIDRMTWLACIWHYVRGHVHKTGHNYNGTTVPILPRSQSFDPFGPRRGSRALVPISYPESSGFLDSGATPGRLWGHQFNWLFWLAVTLNGSPLNRKEKNYLSFFYWLLWERKSKGTKHVLWREIWHKLKNMKINTMFSPALIDDKDILYR